MFYHVNMICRQLLCQYLSLLFLSTCVSTFHLQFCEHTIQTNSNKRPILMLHCQSSDVYEYCKVGELSSKQVKQECKFSKTRFKKYGREYLLRENCDPDEFILGLSYGGIVQSNIDCKVRITELDRKGKLAPFTADHDC